MGGKQACARVENGDVWCWEGDVGGACKGQRPAKVPWLSKARRFGFAWSHGCAVVDGTMRCVGENAHGQLGDGTAIARKDPVDVSW
jgi:hypothetical protein